MDTWRSPENLRWSFQHMAGILTTAKISRGIGPVAPLPAAHRDLDSVTLPLAYFGELPMSVGSVMATTDTDGWMLLAPRAGAHRAVLRRGGRRAVRRRKA